MTFGLLPTVRGASWWAQAERVVGGRERSLGDVLCGVGGLSVGSPMMEVDGVPSGVAVVDEGLDTSLQNIGRARIAHGSAGELLHQSVS